MNFFRLLTNHTVKQTAPQQLNLIGARTICIWFSSNREYIRSGNAWRESNNCQFYHLMLRHYSYNSSNASQYNLLSPDYRKSKILQTFKNIFTLFMTEILRINKTTNSILKIWVKFTPAVIGTGQLKVLILFIHY